MWFRSGMRSISSANSTCDPCLDGGLHMWTSPLLRTLTRAFQSYDEQSDKLAGPIGLLKMHLTKMSRESAEDAQIIFGGRGLTQSGLGKHIESVSPVLLWLQPSLRLV